MYIWDCGISLLFFACTGKINSLFLHHVALLEEVGRFTVQHGRWIHLSYIINTKVLPFHDMHQLHENNKRHNEKHMKHGLWIVKW